MATFYEIIILGQETSRRGKHLFALAAPSFYLHIQSGSALIEGKGRRERWPFRAGANGREAQKEFLGSPFEDFPVSDGGQAWWPCFRVKSLLYQNWGW